MRVAATLTGEEENTSAERKKRRGWAVDKDPPARPQRSTRASYSRAQPPAGLVSSTGPSTCIAYLHCIACPRGDAGPACKTTSACLEHQGSCEATPNKPACCLCVRACSATVRPPRHHPMQASTKHGIMHPCRGMECMHSLHAFPLSLCHERGSELVK